ncbi:Conserved_hypothetical protein [Hexamita inflata]|uniref:Uncharacterized protein n=1 Tax=Hexamita inflata TaxID=28002 RepID=A0AA86NGM5_9EUKA|nr:Conserved hypothetical protein [Hexamita inflata]
MSNKAVCTHSVEQRVLYGYFPDCEMIQAIHLGYRIQKVYETIIYQNSAYNTPEFIGNKYIQKLIYLDFQVWVAVAPKPKNPAVSPHIQLQI